MREQAEGRCREAMLYERLSDNRVQPKARCPRCGATVAGVGMSCQDSSDS